MKKSLLIGFAMVALAACGTKNEADTSNAVDDLAGCDATQTPVYSDISAIMTTYTCTTCHNDGLQSGGVDLSSFAEVSSNVDGIAEAIDAGSMPPSGDPVSADDFCTIKVWVHNGAPET